MSGEERPWLARFVWWHRLKGHGVLRGFGLLTPGTAYRCEECGLTWVRWLG